MGMEFLNAFKTFWKSENNPGSYDIYSILESMWLWRVCGVLMVVPKGSVGHRKYVTSKFAIAYNFTLLCVFIGMLVSRLFDDYIQEYEQSHYGFDGMLCLYLRLSLNSVTMFELFFWKAATNKSFIEMCELLDTQDKVLKKKLEHEFNYKSDTKKSVIYVGFYILAHILMTVQQLSYGVSFSLLIDYFSWWFPIIIHKSNLCLFMSLVWILRLRFNALNQKLDIIIQSSRNRHFQNSFVSESHVEMFRTIAYIHGQLCKIGKNINYIFMPTLVTSAIEAFVVITLILYTFIVAAQRNNYAMHEIFSYFLVLISCGTAIIIIVIICNLTSQKAFAAEKLIHKIRVSEAKSTLSELIQAFSMQMLHQQLSFSVGGLFTLEPALLQAMTGVITTYLVIFIQFGQMDAILLKKKE